MGNCKRLYADTLTFYRQELSGPVFTAGWAFVGIVALSFAASLLFPDQADAIITRYAQMLQQGGLTDESGNIQLFALLMNNLVAMTLSMVYGLIPFIRLPALTLGVNGATLGLFAGYYMHQNISLLKYLLGILPHGIFELTALILSAAMGLYLCETVTNALTKKQTGSVGAAVSRCCRVLLLWVLPLLVIAALVETYITPILFNLV